MAISSYVGFVFAFALVVATPGPGLAAILSRAVSSGIRAGFLVVCGLAIVDVLFLGIAAIGLSAIAEALGPLFRYGKYLAPIYLVYLGMRMIFGAASTQIFDSSEAKSSSWKEVYLGCIVTLGNPKAIMFYVALLPTLFNVSEISMTDYCIMCVLMTAVTFSIYALYIGMTVFAARSVQGLGDKVMARISGTSMIGIGAFVAVRE